MVFAKSLRAGVGRGRIRCSVRIWHRPHVKVGGKYLLKIAKHGPGDHVYLVRFHYLQPGAWDTPVTKA